MTTRVWLGALWFLLWFSIGLLAAFATTQSLCAWLYGGQAALIDVWSKVPRLVPRTVRTNIVFASLFVSAACGGTLGWFAVRMLVRAGVLSEQEGRRVLGLNGPKPQ